MTWIGYALITALLVSITKLFEKKTLVKEHALEFCLLLSLCNLIVVTPFFFRIDFAALSIFSLCILFIMNILGACAFLYTAKALRHLEVSSVAALGILSPLIAALLASIFLKEYLSLPHMTGMFLILGGAYFLSVTNNNLLEPFTLIRKSKYVRYILFAVLILGITSFFDRFLVSHLDMHPEAYIAFSHLFLAIIFSLYFAASPYGFKSLKRGAVHFGLPILVISLLTVAHRYTQIHATALGYIGTVLALKRSSALFTTIIGGAFFHESHLLQKTIACIIMLIGLLFIVT